MGCIIIYIDSYWIKWTQNEKSLEGNYVISWIINLLLTISFWLLVNAKILLIVHIVIGLSFCLRGESERLIVRWCCIIFTPRPSFSTYSTELHCHQYHYNLLLRLLSMVSYSLKTFALQLLKCFITLQETGCIQLTIHGLWCLIKLITPPR